MSECIFVTKPVQERSKWCWCKRDIWLHNITKLGNRLTTYIIRYSGVTAPFLLHSKCALLLVLLTSLVAWWICYICSIFALFSRCDIVMAECFLKLDPVTARVTRVARWSEKIKNYEQIHYWVSFVALHEMSSAIKEPNPILSFLKKKLLEILV